MSAAAAHIVGLLSAVSAPALGGGVNEKRCRLTVLPHVRRSPVGDDPRDRDDGVRDLSRGSRDGSDARERKRVDPRDVLMEGVNLPRGMDRECVHFRDHDYALRGLRDAHADHRRRLPHAAHARMTMISRTSFRFTSCRTPVRHVNRVRRPTRATFGLPIIALPIAARPVAAQVDVTIQHNDNARTGANVSETELTTMNVNAAQFGKLFERAVDHQIYAQPLLVSGLQTPGVGLRNVLYVATVNDTVYAFDADDPAAAAPLWKKVTSTRRPESFRSVTPTSARSGLTPQGGVFPDGGRPR